jgi:hypothetical protein
VKRADHLAINKALKDYENHCNLLLRFVTDQPMNQAEIFELITNEVGYGLTLLANHLLEFGEKE